MLQNSTNYRIRRNIGEELNLVNWLITMRSPNLNLANIFTSLTASIINLVFVTKYTRNLNSVVQNSVDHFCVQGANRL